MTPDELERIVKIGQETRAIEFKSAGHWADTALRGQITRTTLAMANIRDGGVIIVGMQEDDTRPGYHLPQALTGEQRSSFDPDVVVPQVNAHASPHVELSIIHHNLEDVASIVAITVRQFREVPILCIKDIVGENDRLLARRGRVLVRSRRTSETTEVQTPEDLREIVELAVDKGLEAYFRRRRIEEEAATPGDDERFDDQLGPLGV